MRRLRSLLACALLLAAGCATPPLPKSPLRFDASSTIRPDGAGPFPAVVLLHTCGGVGGHLWVWGRRLADAGYVALIVDSNTPRGVGSNCQGAYAKVTLDDVAADASAALAHLRSQPFVGRDRLGVMGFSWGAMASIRLASASYQKRLVQGAEGLRAIAAFYPGCGADTPDQAAQDSYAWGDDIATPTLLLLGALDQETPAYFCTRKADRLKGRGQPIAYKVYPETTHSFDSEIWGTKGRYIRHGARGPFLYRYSAEATEDAWREVKALFERSLKGQD